MVTSHEANCERLRRAFEGRDAIYIEKGVLRVRVTGIRYNVAARHVDADVEEVSASPLAGGFFHNRQGSPRRWKISGGYLTTFSDQTWKTGYAGWSLFFAPEIVNGLTKIATDWPVELNGYERYTRALEFLREHGAYEQGDLVFPD